MSLAPQATQLELFKSALPHRPYCTDELGVLHIRPAATAVQRRYIQHNPPPVIAWMIFDIDRPNSVFAWEDANLPAPAWVATNPKNGHSHIAYGVAVPVARTDLARAAPLKFAAAIEWAYRDKLDADRGYSGLITKNPLHEHWLVYTPTVDGGVYDLAELAEYVKLPKRIPKRDQEVGIGRNVSMFDTLRQWSYSEVRQYWRPNGFNSWHKACVDMADSINAGFTQPLPYSEVKATAKSVAKWVWKTFTPKGFRQVQSARGVRSGKARMAASAEKRAEALALASEGRTQVYIANALGVSQQTVSRWLKTCTKCNLLMNHIR